MSNIKYDAVLGNIRTDDTVITREVSGLLDTHKHDGSTPGGLINAADLQFSTNDRIVGRANNTVSEFVCTSGGRSLLASQTADNLYANTAIGIGTLAPTESLEVCGNIKCSGNIYSRKCGVFATLSGVASTVINTIDVFTPISGIFINYPMEEFIITADPAIQHIGTEVRFFEIHYFAAVSCNVPSQNVYIGININGVLDETSVMTTYCKNSGETYTLGNISVVELSGNDKIQLGVRSDDVGDILTFRNFSTTIKPFF